MFLKPGGDQSQEVSTSAALDEPRKRGRPRKTHNPALEALEKSASLHLKEKRQSLPANPKPRRLTSMDQLYVDGSADMDDDIDVLDQPSPSQPSTSSSKSQAKTTNADDYIFKLPNAPVRKSLRKSKSDKVNKSQMNDSTANASKSSNATGNANASTSSRQATRDEFDFSLDMNNLMADDELQAYMSQNSRTLSNTQPSNGRGETSNTSNNEADDSDTDTNQVRNTRNNGAKSKTTKKRNDSNNETSRVQKSNGKNDSNARSKGGHSKSSNDEADSKQTQKNSRKNVQSKGAKSKGSSDQADSSGNANDSQAPRTISRRRPSRETQRDTFLAEYFSTCKPKSSQSNQSTVDRKKRHISMVTDTLAKRKLAEPPTKKSRTEPVTQRKSAKSSTSNVSKMSDKPTRTSKSKPKESMPSTSSAKSPKTDGLADFKLGLTQKRLSNQKFWKDLINYEKDNEIEHEDIVYIKVPGGVFGEFSVAYDC